MTIALGTNRGNILHESENYQEALLSYQKALQIKPDHYKSWYNRGQTFSTNQRTIKKPYYPLIKL